MKKNTTIIVFILLSLVLFLAYRTWKAQKELPQPETPVAELPLPAAPVSDYKNASYSIDGKTVTLVNGVSEVVNDVDSSSKIITKYFGNEIEKDLNNDGRKDIIFLLTQETGGSGVFFYVAAALNTEKWFVGSSAVLLWDRIAPQTTESGPGDSIIINYADHSLDEPLSSRPSVGKSMYLILDSGTMELRKTQ